MYKYYKLIYTTSSCLHNVYWKVNKYSTAFRMPSISLRESILKSGINNGREYPFHRRKENKRWFIQSYINNMWREIFVHHFLGYWMHGERIWQNSRINYGEVQKARKSNFNIVWVIKKNFWNNIKYRLALTALTHWNRSDHRVGSWHCISYLSISRRSFGPDWHFWLIAIFF